MENNENTTGEKGVREETPTREVPAEKQEGGTTEESEELTPEVQILEVQNEVFTHEIAKKEKESGSSINPLSVVAENAVLFRDLAKHLQVEYPETLKKAAHHDPQAIYEIEAEFERFRSEVERTLAQTSPETMTKLTDAINRGDVAEASKILEDYLAAHERLSA